nr:receptor-like protein 12 [Ipomoea batatas]
MERLILLFFILLVQAIVSSSETHLCHNDQASALLQIKNALTIDESVSLECDSRLKFEPHSFKHLLQNLTQLRELDLSGIEISSVLPRNLSSSLRILSLGSTGFFTGRVPLTLVSLEQLIRFDLSANNLTGEIPDFFGKFGKLKDLSLADNLFTGRFPVSVTNLTKLESLDLSNASISGPIPPIVSGFPALVLLFLGENLLTGEIPSWVFHLPLLKYIDMKSNNLSGRIEGFSSEEMVHIDLSDNKLQGSIPSSISKLVNLTALYLSSNNFSGTLDVGTFSNLRQLRHLGLSYNSISLSAAHKEIALPDSIGNLWLSSCDIRELDFLRAAKNLGQLDLSRNKIRGQIPDWALSNWGSSVYYLNLSFNSLTEKRNPELLELCRRLVDLQRRTAAASLRSSDFKLRSDDDGELNFLWSDVDRST